MVDCKDPKCGERLEEDWYEVYGNIDICQLCNTMYDIILKKIEDDD